MVQSINNNQNGFGTINKVGASPDGRIVYQVIGKDGQTAGSISVARQDCDTFERSFNTIVENGMKLQQYAATHTEEDMKRTKKASRWIMGLSAFAGGSVFMFRKNIKHPVLKTALGTLGGLVAGIGISLATTTPPGSLKMAKASKTMSKLDVRAYEG